MKSPVNFYKTQILTDESGDEIEVKPPAHFNVALKPDYDRLELENKILRRQRDELIKDACDYVEGTETSASINAFAAICVPLDAELQAELEGK